MSAPGLDIARLQALRTPRVDLDRLQRRIRAHLDQWEGYVAFSGGKDSLVVLDLVLQVDPDVPVVFFHSGLEYPETIRYIDQLTDRWRLNLHTIPAPIPGLDLLAHSGTWDHQAPTRPIPPLRDVLITEPAHQAHALFGPGELWGVRAGESHGRGIAYRRALTTACTCDRPCPNPALEHGGVITRQDGTCAYGPIWNWNTPQVHAHIASHRLPLNPLYQRLRDLGAPESAQRLSTLIDGEHLETGRLTWLQRGWPGLFSELAVVLPRVRELA